ncbi:MAG: tyrosine-protein phosphatase [Gammaproteobacteria bacterium]
MHDPRRELSFPALLNARDLGGYQTLDGARTRWRSLLRADDLGQLTPDGVQALEEFGVETVVDLRWPEEVSASPSPVARELPHIRYQRIALLGRTEAEWRALSTECPKELWKCVVLDQSRTELREVLRTIAAASPGPLLFHCVAGKDRTGIIAALLLTLADVVPDAIAYDYAVSTERLRDAYLRCYPDLEPEEILEALRCPEEGVHHMLEYLAGLGGIRAYLELIGLHADEITQLRARLRER